MCKESTRKICGQCATLRKTTTRSNPTSTGILTDKRRKHGIVGPDDDFPATGDDRNQKSNQGCLGDVSQVQTGADIKKLYAQTSTPAVRRRGNSDDILRIGNMDTHKKSTKELFNRRNAKCFDSSYKRREDTKRS